MIRSHYSFNQYLVGNSCDFTLQEQNEDEGYYSQSSSLSSNNSDGSASFGMEKKWVVADSISAIDECEESLTNLSLARFKPDANCDEVKKENIHQELGKFKEASLVQRLLSFAALTTLSKTSRTATRLANAGFVVLQTSFGVCFGCPDCKLVCNLPLKDIYNPRAFHESQSPGCATLRSSTETEIGLAMKHQTAYCSEGLYNIIP